MFESLLDLFGPKQARTCAHFGLLHRLRLAHWCGLGSRHSLCGQPQFAASALCWVDDVSYGKALWTSLHPLSLAYRCIRPFLTRSAAIDWVSSLKANYVDNVDNVDRGKFESRSVACGNPKAKHTLNLPLTCKPWLHQIPQTKWALVFTKTSEPRIATPPVEAASKHFDFGKTQIGFENPSSV